MSQITRGLRAILSNSKVYDLCQGFMGARSGRSLLSAEYIRAREGDRVLDIGCGTAEIRDFLQDVEYYGFDPNPRYIKSARKRLRNIPGNTFICAAVDEMLLNALPKFDIVLALGVMHHLDDSEAFQLARLAKSALKDEGRLISVDPCFVQDQSYIARHIIMLDRGQNVRELNGYEDIFNGDFIIAKADIHHDLMRFPYTHLIMECVVK